MGAPTEMAHSESIAGPSSSPQARLAVAQALARAASSGLFLGLAACGSEPAPPVLTIVEVPLTATPSQSSAPPLQVAERYRSLVSTPNCCKGRNECKGLGNCRSAAGEGCRGKNDCKAKGGCRPAVCPSAEPARGACCKGKNECKGQGNCKSDANDCKGKNECKGKGGCKPSRIDCD